jgi:hypothetical protein
MIRPVTFHVRVREHLVPVTVKTNFPAKREWLLQLQHHANSAVWGHAPEFIAQLARDGLNLGALNEGDL